MKALNTLFSVACVSLFFSLLWCSTANAEDVLCVRKIAKVRNQKRVQVARTMTVRTGACNRNEVAVLTGLDAESLLAKLKTVDGASSGLDADTIDGVQASELATASSVSTNTSSIQTIEGAVEDLGMGPRLVRVGTANSQYTDLAEAISFVNSQTRSATNRWLIKVGPGTFELDSNTTIPQYVELQGSGIDSTIVTSQNGIDIDALLTMGVDTVVSQMTVRHTQTENLGATSVIRISTSATGDLANSSSVTTVIRDAKLELTTLNSSPVYGIFRDGPLRIERTTLRVDSDAIGYGISTFSNISPPLFVSDSEIAVENNGTGAAIRDTSTQGIKLSNVRLTASLRILEMVDGAAQIFNAELLQGSAGNLISSIDASVSLFSSIIPNSATFSQSGTGTNSCYATFRADGTALDSSCVDVP